MELREVLQPYFWVESNLFSDVSKYEVTDKIGRGKYADVFKGVNMETGAEVALKVLHPRKLFSLVTKKKIQREVWVMQKLKDCTSTAKLLEVVRDPGPHSISLVLEYVPSADYRELYPKFTDAEVRQYMFQLFKALDQIHSKGIIHRDIKPHNIAYDPKTKNLKIIDFGLGVQSNTFDSRLMEADCGTVIYMSPERLAKARCSQKADVYSVGIILLELLQGPLAKTLHFKEKHQLRLFLQDNTWDLSNSGCSM